MLNLILAVLGLVGVSGFVAAVRSSRHLGRHYRFFRLRQGEQVDIVLPTSARTEGGFGGVKYLRSVTALGNLKAATELAQLIGYGSFKRQISVSVSAELDSHLLGDLVVIGLPGKNEISRLVLDHLEQRYEGLGLVVEEADGACRMGLKGFSETFEVELQPDGLLPSRDIALIVLWVNPLTARKRRLILCAGFTSYGTAAASSYLVDTILSDRLHALRQAHPELPKLRDREWVCFVMIVETHLVNDQFVDLEELAFAVLEDPGTPPFGSASRRTPAPVPATPAEVAADPAAAPAPPAEIAPDPAPNGHQGNGARAETGRAHEGL